MAKKNETVKTLVVAGVLCFVCSIIVSITVVTLKPLQEKNAEIDFKKNVLNAAGMLKEGADVEATFDKINTIMVDIETGKVMDSIDPLSFDQKSAASNPDYGVKIDSSKDIAGLNMRSKYAKVFLVKEAGQVTKIILPITSMGLWAKMYGFIALAGDTNTIEGFSYYQHGETPGLGAEVDNPKWKKQWIGKKLYGESGDVEAAVKKLPTDENHHVDALSGATITSNGVDSSLKYWFGSDAYKKFLVNVKQGEL
jgi:Na+-transporting NADH:ubiquinone oxidoreductase subunit C